MRRRLFTLTSLARAAEAMDLSELVVMRDRAQTKDNSEVFRRLFGNHF